MGQKRISLRFQKGNILYVSCVYQAILWNINRLYTLRIMGFQVDGRFMCVYIYCKNHGISCYIYIYCKNRDPKEPCQKKTESNTSIGGSNDSQGCKDIYIHIYIYLYRFILNLGSPLERPKTKEMRMIFASKKPFSAISSFVLFGFWPII